ncbi:hypothetical protein ACLKA7_003560 [Drosophila subpalustris]
MLLLQQQQQQQLGYRYSHVRCQRQSPMDNGTTTATACRTAAWHKVKVLQLPRPVESVDVASNRQVL